jgi:hypothetical protein
MNEKCIGEEALVLPNAERYEIEILFNKKQILCSGGTQ